MTHTGPDAEEERVAIPTLRQGVGHFHEDIRPYLPPNDMGNGHLVVVNHRSEVICWE